MSRLGAGDPHLVLFIYKELEISLLLALWCRESYQELCLFPQLLSVPWEHWGCRNLLFRSGLEGEFSPICY